MDRRRWPAPPGGSVRTDDGDESFLLLLGTPIATFPVFLRHCINLSFCATFFRQGLKLKIHEWIITCICKPKNQANDHEEDC